MTPLLSEPTAETSAQGNGLTVLLAVVGAPSDLAGVTRHAVNLALCLLSRAEVSLVYFVVASWQVESLRSALPSDDPRLHIREVRIAHNTIARNLWYYNELPRLASQWNVDIVHLSYPAPIKPGAFRGETVTTLHDLYPYDMPANFGLLKMFFNRIVLQQCLRTVDAIACVSESTLSRLDMFAPSLAMQKAVVIYNCVTPGPPMGAVSPIAGWQDEPFLLCVAQHRRNKNIVLAMQIFERLRESSEVPSNALLVIIGIAGPETASIRRFIRDSRHGANIILLHGITEAQLKWCYGHCELLLAPSIVEGFGLPVVEAMLHQCRIVCSDIPAFREVGGSYCYYADLEPNPLHSFVEAIRLALTSHKFRPATTDRFSRPRIAEAYIQLYLQLRKSSSRALESPSRHAQLVEKGSL